jgi:hypothetical protein
MPKSPPNRAIWRPGLLHYALGAGSIVACLVVADRSFSSSPPPRAPSAVTTTGTIQLAPVDPLYCPHMAFDNESGELRFSGLQLCVRSARVGPDRAAAHVREGFGRR